MKFTECKKTKVRILGGDIVARGDHRVHGWSSDGGLSTTTERITWSQSLHPFH